MSDNFAMFHVINYSQCHYFVSVRPYLPCECNPGLSSPLISRRHRLSPAGLGGQANARLQSGAEPATLEQRAGVVVAVLSDARRGPFQRRLATGQSARRRRRRLWRCVGSQSEQRRQSPLALIEKEIKIKSVSTPYFTLFFIFSSSFSPTPIRPSRHCAALPPACAEQPRQPRVANGAADASQQPPGFRRAQPVESDGACLESLRQLYGQSAQPFDTCVDAR